jgi:hypothetical protein
VEERAARSGLREPRRLTPPAPFSNLGPVPRSPTPFYLALAFLAALLLAPLARAEGPAPASSSSAAPATAVVRVHERATFTLKAPRGEQSVEVRARAASNALGTVVDLGEPPDARIEEGDGVAVIYVGKTPIVTLGDEDAAAEGETLHVYASTVAARIEEGVRAEETRSSIASTVFSVSLLVFSGLMAFLLFRRVGERVARGRTWIDDNPDRIPALRLRLIEVVRPNAVRGAARIALGLGHLVAQIAIGYGWLLFALSLFSSTRDYTERLTGFVLTPLWGLLGRVGSALPIVVVAVMAAVAVGVLVRFVALFFEGVAQGDTSVAWLPRDLAAPTSVLARAAIVLAALVLAAPMLTGTDNGALSRVGVAILLAVGLAATPVIASVAVGLPVVFGRRLPVGLFVDIGGYAGRVKRLSLLSVTLEAYDGAELRVPHLLGLVRATRVLGTAAPVSFEIVVDGGAGQARVRELLVATVTPLAARSKVALVSLDGDGARYSVVAAPATGAPDIPSAVADALRAANVPLGRARGVGDA